MSASLYLGIDVGTGSSKGVLATADGAVVATAVRSHEMSMPAPGRAEFDAQGTWWAEVCQIARELTQGRDPGSLGGLCVSGMGPCLVLTDEHLVPVRPAILYGVDMRAAREIGDLTERYGSEEIMRDCGTTLSSQAVGPKVEWVARNEPEIFEKATRFFGLNSYIAAKLTGAYVQDHHSASQSDPLYSMGEAGEAGAWNNQRWLEICRHLPQPELVWPHEVVGSVTPLAAEETGLPVGLPVSAGSVDAWLEALSAGVREAGDLMLMYGSTMFVTHTVTRASAHPLLWLTKGIQPGTSTLAAGMATSGSVLGWWQKMLGGQSFEELDVLAATTPPGADGLLSLPYYAGERTPIFDPRARGVLMGMTLSHTRGHVVRAQYEGIGFAVRQVLELLEAPEHPIRMVVAVGGGAQSPVWTQAVSDITGREQWIPEQTIGASYGDALLAAIGTGAVSAETTWATRGRVVTPQAEHAELYDRMSATYDGLYLALRGAMHELADIQGQS